ncbi:BF3164 family lipoprotein [Gracilimonas sp. Q87]|uniref:BF3164 family lipoprotein n=1 Tax=Gracilimonas sp. Q87 TaxID=3384766 RepID=UPI003983EC5D
MSISITVIILGITACTTSTKEKNHFQRTIDYQSVKTSRAVLAKTVRNPKVVRIIDDKIVIGEVGGSPSIHMFQIKEDGGVEYLKGIGREGRGPGEYERLMEIIDSDSLFYVYDGNQFSLTAYNTNGELRDHKRRELTTRGLPNSMFMLKDGSIVAAGVFLNERIQVFDETGSIKTSLGDYIVFDKNFTPRDNGIAWLSHAAMNLGQNYICLFAENADFIEKYDMEGTLLKRVQGEKYPLPSMILEDNWPVDNNGIVGYTDVVSNDHHLYASYSGIPRSEDSSNPFETDLIQEFDWNLNLEHGYKLDHKPTEFVVGNNDVIYTLNESNGGYEIRLGHLK